MEKAKLTYLPQDNCYMLLLPPGEVGMSLVARENQPNNPVDLISSSDPVSYFPYSTRLHPGDQMRIKVKNGDGVLPVSVTCSNDGIYYSEDSIETSVAERTGSVPFSLSISQARE